MDLNPKHLAVGVALAAVIGAAPAVVVTKLDDSPRVRAAIYADGCASAVQELHNFCATNPKMKDCPAIAAWVDNRCRERAKRD